MVAVRTAATSGGGLATAWLGQRLEAWTVARSESVIVSIKC